MPRYKVLQPGCYGPFYYTPTGKRSVLHTDKPLNPVPSWLELLPDESAIQEKQRNLKMAKKKLEDTGRVTQDKIEKDSVMFLGPQPTITL